MLQLREMSPIRTVVLLLVSVLLPGVLHAVNAQQGDVDVCQVSYGVSYIGTVNVTESGRVCQRWDSQTPHYHNFEVHDFPETTLRDTKNYCRNPDVSAGVWCYTTDPGVRWEYCDVPVCSILAYDERQCNAKGGFCVNDTRCCPYDYYVTDQCGYNVTTRCCLNTPDCNWREKQGELAKWPEGNFALLRTIYDCPQTSNLQWEHAMANLDSAPYGRSIDFHLLGPMTSQRLTLHFCLKLETFLPPDERTGQLAWPQGSYCIFQAGNNCPRGFISGNMTVQAENPQFRADPLAPISTSENGDMLFRFCCRHEISPETRILMPSEGQFTLLKIGETCQEVHHMFVTEEYLQMTLDGEANVTFHGMVSNITQEGGQLNITYCYYQRYETCYRTEDQGNSYMGWVNFQTNSNPCPNWADLGVTGYTFIDNYCRNPLGYTEDVGCGAWSALPCPVPACPAFDNDSFRKLTAELTLRGTRQKDGSPISAFAFDGDSLTCSLQTYASGGSWWQLDMQGNFEVHAVFMIVRGVQTYLMEFHMLDIYVGQTNDDFEDMASLYCRRNVSLRVSNVEALLVCIQPVRGHFLTIRNAAHEEHNTMFPQGEVAFNLCEVEVYVKEVACSQPLGRLSLQAPGQFVASSGNPISLPLYSTEAWCADTTDVAPYVLVDLGVSRRVDALETQGAAEAGSDGPQMVTNFMVRYGLQLDQLLDYTDDWQQPKMFVSGADSYAPFLHPLRHTIHARYVMVLITEWTGRACMRVGLRGCKRYQGSTANIPTAQIARIVGSTSGRQDLRWANVGQTTIVIWDTETYTAWSNLAEGKGWKYSSQIQLNGPDAVTDGRLDSCVVTENEADPRITLDLGGVYMVSDIIIRQDTNVPGYKMCTNPTDLGFSYGGPVNVSVTGHSCIPWSDSDYSDLVGYEYFAGNTLPYYDNYCRNALLEYTGPECQVSIGVIPCPVPLCHEYLYEMDIWVRETADSEWILCQAGQHWGMARIFPFQCSRPIAARYVELRSRQAPSFLYVCEMEVYGATTDAPIMEVQDDHVTLTCAEGKGLDLQAVEAVTEVPESGAMEELLVQRAVLDIWMSLCDHGSSSCSLPLSLAGELHPHSPGRYYRVTAGCFIMEEEILLPILVEVPGVFISTWHYLAMAGQTDWKYWHVQIRQGFYISLQVIDLALELPEDTIQEGAYERTTGGCGDGLYVTYTMPSSDGHSPRLPAGGKFTYMSPSNALRLELQTCRRYSPVVNTQRLLEVSYEEQASPGCDSQYFTETHECTSSSGHVMSGGFPVLYSLNQDQLWTLTVAEVDSILLTVVEMDIPELSSPNCQSDYLEILDAGRNGELNSLGQFCNMFRPFGPLESAWNAMVIRFKSNNDEMVGRGFLVSYESVRYTVQNITDAGEGCDAGWYAATGKCFRYEATTELVTWLEAEDVCASSHRYAHLTSILSHTEAILIHTLLLANAGDVTEFYIGLTDRYLEGEWEWSDGSGLSYTNWATSDEGPDEPDGVNIEDCAIISLSSRRLTRNWQDIPCARERTNSFVCSYRLKSDIDVVIAESSVTNYTGDLYHCGSGECVGETYLCDGTPDCADLSDEEDCDALPTFVAIASAETCPWYSFNCGDGTCVSLSMVCDFKQDCPLGQDEDWCVHSNCTSNQFRCNSGQCLAESLRCNLELDCWDGSDEQDCTFCQSTVTFQCFDGTCLPSSRVCDATADCNGQLVEDEAEICSSVMPATCREWRLAGYTDDGYYDINPDGTGIIQVGCDMTSQPGQVTTILHHNSEGNFSVQGYEGAGSYVRYFDYFVTQQQVVALKAASSSCDQYWAIGCLRSEFYTRGSAFWRSLATGEYYDYSEAGNNTCDCVMSQACEEGKARCNCYSPSYILWSGDSGIVTFNVPISELQGGDTGSAFEEAWHMIGPLQCYQEFSEDDASLRCQNGQVYRPSMTCLLDQDQYGTILGCRDLSHLQQCEIFQCPEGYAKCFDSFCVAAHLVCNGKPDCPYGEDEYRCENHTCTGMYSCRGSFQCLPLTQRCDGMRQCRQGDDEWYCGLGCPAQCQCNGQTYICQEGGFEDIPEQINADARKLDLGDNWIRLNSSSFAGHVLLVELGLSRNSIDYLPIYMFQDLSMLRVLDLSSNALTILEADSFMGLINLRSLSLAGNPLAQLQPGCFRDLNLLPELHLRSMDINRLQSGVFQGLNVATLVDVSNNIITKIEPDALRPIQDVLRLNISFNDLKEFRKADFEALTSLKFLASDDFMFCCFVNEVLPPEQCLPEADEFSSCTDLMKNNVLRVLLWLLGFLACFGNVFVLVWRSSGQENKTTSSFLVRSLAIADLLMSFYLIGIASVDVYYRGIYIENAATWRASDMCRFLGVVAAVSSETSVFTLGVITADRLINIVAPFSNYRLSLKGARVVIFGIWVLILSLAMIPLLPVDYFGGTFYSRSGVCISIHITNEETPGWEYSVAIFHGLNFVIFVFIMSAYGYMYQVIKDSGKAAGSKEQKLELAAARKMTLIAFSDFCCWAPINVMGVLAMSGVSIPGKVYAWVVVCVLPVNSALNPILYTISSLNIYRKKKAQDRALASSIAAMGSASQVTLVSELQRGESMTFDNLLRRIEFRDFAKVFEAARAILQVIMQVHENKMILGALDGKHMTFEEYKGDLSVSIRSNLRSFDLDPNGQAEDMEQFARILGRLMRPLVAKPTADEKKTACTSNKEQVA